VLSLGPYLYLCNIDRRTSEDRKGLLPKKLYIPASVNNHKQFRSFRRVYGIRDTVNAKRFIFAFSLHVVSLRNRLSQLFLYEK
jgi:hypothetical protein